MTDCLESTLSYYEKHATAYAEKTRNVDMTKIYERFLKYIPSGGSILDAGSGSGRDTLAFITRGYQVEALDASPTLAELSTQLTAVPTKTIRFQEFHGIGQYDGIWTCASLLHVKKHQLRDTLEHLRRGLKPGGTMYVSFKVGTGERIAPDGRCFTDMNEEGLQELLQRLSQLSIVEIWTSPGEGTFYRQGEWLNALLRNSI